MHRIKILIILLILSVSLNAQRFTNTDSLKRYVDRYINNSAVNAFQNLRLNTALKAIIDEIDSVQASVQGGVRVLDTLYKLNDTSLVFRIKGVSYRIPICGCSSSTGSPSLSILTNPTSQSVTEGASASFTASATGGTTPYTHQWQKGTTNITGATSGTYTISSTVLADAGNYRDIITDAAAASVSSAAATLTVNAVVTSPTVTYGYSSTDPFVNNTTAPVISSPVTITVTHNADIVFSLPAAAADKFWVVKVPVAESNKISWYHNTDNSGPIPGDVVRAWTVGGFRYYASVAEFVLTYTDSIQLKQ